MGGGQDYNEAVLSEFHDKVVRGELGNHAHAAGLDTLMQQVILQSHNFCNAGHLSLQVQMEGLI